MGKNRSQDIYTETDVEVIDLPDYALEWAKSELDAYPGQPFWWGGIPNKYNSIKWLCDNKNLRDEDTLLFLDPDMVFLEPITYKPEDDEIIAQRFIDYSPLEKWTAIPEDKHGWGVMFPFCINVKTMKKIVNDYKMYCEEIRRAINKWESEMWGLDFAVKKNNLKITYVEDFGYCTPWMRNDSMKVSKIIHFPNQLLNKSGERIWFKQDYTGNPNMVINPNNARNEIERKLLLEVSQERTDYLYYLKYDSQNILKNHTGTNGYVIFKPWGGGFNNIRMSLELAVCIAYLTDKTLVLPPKYKMYLLKDEVGLEDFFDVDDMGIKIIFMEEFCKLKGIDVSYEAVKAISKVISEKTDNCVFNFEKIEPSQDFRRHRNLLNDTFLADECIFFDDNLLGNFYQTLHTNKDIELKKLIARNVHYLPKIFDLGWKSVSYLGDKSYYAIHIRRNDFQYKDLFIGPEEIYNNIKDIVPEGSRLYVATDYKDTAFFDVLKSHYELIFYSDIAKVLPSDVHHNYIPIIEQLICTRAIKFIGNENSTLSSYVYRLRGYMNDTEDKNYYVNTKIFSAADQAEFREHKRFTANWAREYKDAWNFEFKKIFVSVAAYRDTQLIPTLTDLYETVANGNRVVVGVHIQNTTEEYKNLLAQNFPNIKIIFTETDASRGVVWARERIKKELLTDEEYFLQIDAHSRFKFGWDNILVNQMSNMEGKVVISTYPNGFFLEDVDRIYVKRTPTNAPLTFNTFFTDHAEDNRINVRNLAALKDYNVVDSRWVAGGFIFAPKEWIDEIKFSDQIFSKGEEEVQFYLSYLKGWDVKVPSEAVVWHNYNATLSDGTQYRIPFLNKTDAIDNSANILNDVLFNQTHTRTVEDLEKFLGIKFRTGRDTIFVALTSFIDHDLRNTILSCIQQAKHPENLSFGLILQYDNTSGTHEKCVDDLIERYKIRVKKYWYENSMGGCWARNEVANLVVGEKYILQIDAHTRFIKDWDEILLKDMKTINTKCIISYLSPPFRRNKELGIDYEFKHIDNPYILNIPKISMISEEYWPDFMGYANEHHTNQLVRQVSLLYAGFVFAPASWYRDVKNDPEHYYTGEEFALSIRSYTHGYDIYQPSRIVSWHKSGPDHVHHFKALPTGDDLHRRAMGRLKLLIEGGDLGRYGLGNSRTLQDYENFARINIKEKKIYE
jgi:hypothetical protein